MEKNTKLMIGAVTILALAGGYMFWWKPRQDANKVGTKTAGEPETGGGGGGGGTGIGTGTVTPPVDPMMDFPQGNPPPRYRQPPTEEQPPVVVRPTPRPSPRPVTIATLGGLLSRPPITQSRPPTNLGATINNPPSRGAEGALAYSDRRELVY